VGGDDLDAERQAGRVRRDGNRQQQGADATAPEDVLHVRPDRAVDVDRALRDATLGVMRERR
jgi:hypothetical protein